jgi:(4S)-4-hydroxy-5-phosphonooxypentane-2,3-dione isomerase
MPLSLILSSRWKLPKPLITVVLLHLLLLSFVSALSLQTARDTIRERISAMGPYCLNVKLSIRPDQRETFLALIKEDQEQSLTTEPDCLQFVVGEDVDTPNTFYLHEEYKTEAGFQHHVKTPHWSKWNDFCQTNPWSDVTPVVEFYHGTHTQTEQWPCHDHPVYCLNVNLYPKPQVREEFLKVIANNKIGTDSNEPLCLQYVYGENTETPHAFHFHEEYAGEDHGKEGFIAHTKAPHFAAWEAFANTGEPFSKPPVVNFFKII